MTILPLIFPPPPGRKIGTVQVADVPSAPSTQRVQRAPNNYRTKSRHFHPMNNQIVYFDNEFKTLPPLGPLGSNTQQGWNDAVAIIAPWDLCGCAKTVKTGQQLYRSEHLIANMLGVPPPGSPPVSYFGASADSYEVQRLTYFPFDRCLMSRTSFAPYGYMVFNAGLGLDNPIFQWPAGDANFVLHAPTPPYDYLKALPNNSVIDVCFWNGDLSPGTSAKCWVHD